MSLVDMLNSGEELFLFEKEFFVLSKKYLEMDEIGELGEQMILEFDALEKKYSGMRRFNDEYVHSRILWFGQMVATKRMLKKRNEL